MIQYCLYCQKPFTISYDNKKYKLFCSDTCLHEYISTHNCNTATCTNCGKPYVFLDKDRQFCSSNCKREYTRKQLSYNHVCLCCGDKFTSHYESGNFCSRACATTYISRFHNMGYFIKNQNDWERLKSSISMIPSTYTLPSCLMTQYEYFSGYYMDIHHEVRSGSEHNLCRFLQLLQIDYDYEVYTFRLSNGKTYRPDIYIPSEDTFYEMKGEWHGDAYEKVQQFLHEYSNIKLIIIDMKTYLDIENNMKRLFPHINFDKHIRIKNRLIRHIPQFRVDNIHYDSQELNYWFFTNKVDISLLKSPVTVSDELSQLIISYRLSGKIYYAEVNGQLFYNKDDIDQLKNQLKSHVKVMIPNIIRREIKK